ncbi:bifunctional 4-hydroxy-2-oxoglutarate aldolase/2-dehydro-3-deoxy-phosphogluconate aldolase [Maribacter dokdonensis]|uniref:bifunctional 4-hydroxy-2-oxoglutarate aldolase/2-dehydro-3-deoxy-phosphogluconate aldolase n=1 Tax=Maribacter dokdonensis TaxID=320912 RepID=UPI003291816A
MNRKEIVARIKNEKIVAILRTKSQNDVPQLVKIVLETGVDVLEITSNTPGYLEEITNARALYPNTIIGVGTAVNVKIAEQAIAAGAQFLVTPNTNVDVVALSHKYDVPVLMGAMTPSEVCVASENGADVVKLFPAGAMGLQYFKALKAPLDHIEYFAVGGINPNNVGDWFKAGASGIGYGCVVNDAKTGKIDFEASKKLSEDFVNQAKSN